VRRWLAGVLFLLVGISGAQAHELLERIDACVARLDRELDVGYERVAARCPDLAPTLAASPWAEWLPHDWNQTGNQLSAGGLADLRTLLLRYGSAAPAPAHPPSVARLGSILATLAAAHDSHAGWWERFKHWLRGILARREEVPESDWLQRLLGGGSLPTAVIWVTLGLVVLLAGAIVANELRLAGVLRAPRRRAGRAVSAAAASGPGLHELEQADVLQQPRLLLELIAAQLSTQQRLPPARALTVRELVRAARLADAEDRARLDALGGACERMRYANGVLPAQALAAAIAQGRALLAALQARQPAPVA